MNKKESLFQVGDRVRVKSECDIPEMFRNGPSEGVIERVTDDGTLVVIVDGKAVPYQQKEVEADG